MKTRDLPTPILVAAMLGWAWGVGMLLVSVAVGIPALVSGQGVPAAATAALLSGATIVGAHGLGRRRRPWLMIGACLGWFAYLWLIPLRVSPPGFAANALILGLVIYNLRAFYPTR